MVKQGVRERPDVAALASREPAARTILAWHYHDDDVPGPAADVSLVIEGLGEARQGEAAAFPHRRRPQQRLRRMAADGLAGRRHPRNTRN